MFVFLSPHFDDAIGSAGAVIRKLVESGEECCVMTIMAAIPWHRPTKIKYVLHRRNENKNAADVLKCDVKNAPFLDAIYRKGLGKEIKKQLFTVEVTELDLIKNIRAYILKNTKTDDILIAPAGLGNHIDHRIVNRAVQDVPNRIYFYEEFHYDRKEKHREMITADYQYVFLTQDEITEKINSMLKYKKTLRKLLLGKDWKDKIKEYFLSKRIYNDKPYERFNDISFLKSYPSI
jgi:LmbE family N-acetylglucosaminyl deacetylase